MLDLPLVAEHPATPSEKLSNAMSKAASVQHSVTVEFSQLQIPTKSRNVNNNLKFILQLFCFLILEVVD